MKWQPIETAPTEFGSRVLLYVPAMEGIYLCVRRSDAWEVDMDGYFVEGATHWMELPDIPKVS